MKRTFWLTKLTFDSPFDTGGEMRAEGTLDLSVTHENYPSGLSITASLSEALKAKIVWMVELEIAAQLEAEPHGTGEPPKVRELVDEDEPF